jgi:hypothetical protein
MEREEAEMHAQPLGEVPALLVPPPPKPEIFKVHKSIEGLSRFYANMQLKTQGEFQERFDLLRQSAVFQTPEQTAANLRAVQKDAEARAARDREDEARGYIKRFHSGFTLKQ